MTSRNLSLRPVLAGLALSLTAGLVAAPAAAEARPAPGTHAGTRTEPIVVAHRGASGYRPEHTLAAYRLAIRMGADYVEPDLVSTRDGVLVARHENEISGTTDVAAHPEFADRRTTKTIDGRPVTGWFTEDFTLAELKTLRAVERLPQVRPDNTRYDGRFEVPTLVEVLQMVREESRGARRTIGVYPETKHPTYFDSIGLSLEEPLVRTLDRFGLDRKRSKVIVQSFETANLRELDHLTDVPLAQLVDASGAPYDLVAAGDDRTYDDLLTRAGLRRIARYADGIGAHKNRVLPRDPATGATGRPSDVVRDAHRAGLVVHVWTVRDENQFMATNFQRGTDPNAKGDVRAEVVTLLDAGVDGIFADHPDSAVDALEDWLG
ncbi:glycerophosphodiester phosphodiesterase [Nocardioides dongkuii]|uniref:glycerophosphodiester phosphodiesterase n=1 Tax=Nocardioides dongkuii TaxID=2760089 RepID=UPI0015FE0E3D|nr:glycerophosphodiester phosphodiesterase [Nocardioides dongkuii]